MSSAGAPTRNDNPQQAIDYRQVVDFLRSQPDFFRQHPDVLANMTLPHASGNAVSLVERQVAILRDRSMQTRHKLSELLDIAKDNDALFAKTQALVIALMQASSTEELIAVTQRHFREQFFVELTHILVIADEPEQLATKIGSQHLCRRADADEHIASVLNAGQTLCGVLRDVEANFIFTEDVDTASGSVAIATRELEFSGRGGRATLLLAVAHHDSNHYNNNTGTLFIDHIADILQILFGQLVSAE